MLAVDIFFVVVLGLAFLAGLRRGLFKVVGSLVGLVVGAWIASHYYLAGFDWLVQRFSESWLISKIAVFIILFFLASNLTAWAFSFLGGILEAITIIPLMKTANRLLGGLLNLAEAALSWSLILFFLSRYLPTSTELGQQLSQSIIAPYLMTIGKILWPLLPVVLKQMQALW
jgi:uncharacterized membrane protein required for colicin V production